MGDMMEWIDYRTDKPKHDILAVVTNAKGWMHKVMARYDYDSDVWIEDNANNRITLTLEVTHYVPLPMNWPRDIERR